MARHGGLEFRQINRRVEYKLLRAVRLDWLVCGPSAIEFAAIIDVCLRLRVEFKNAILAAGFNRHIGNGRAVVDRKTRGARPVELHSAISGAVETDFTNGVQNDV